MLDLNNGAKEVSISKELENSFKDSVSGLDQFQTNTSGLIVVDEMIGGNTEQHVTEMRNLLGDKSIKVDAITQNLDYPLVVYSLAHNNIVHYYVTVVIGDTKKGPSLTNFVSSLQSNNKENQILYTPDTKYDENYDKNRVIRVLSERYPNISKVNNVGVSVVNYNNNTYASIASYVRRVVLAGPYLISGIDQDKNFTKENVNIRYENITEGQITSDTGTLVRADFSLSLSVPKTYNPNEGGSKNEINSDYVTVYGYIDLAMVEEIVPPIPGQPISPVPVKVTKLSPSIIITYIKGISALPGFGVMGIITGGVMSRYDMYFGHIINNISKYQDIISVAVGNSINFSKMSFEEKVAAVQQILTVPAFAIDVPNNGYMEELSFLVGSNREVAYKEVAERFTKDKINSQLILGDVAIPLTEIFDKKLLDGRAFDSAGIASKGKDQTWVIHMTRFTNDVDRTTNANSIPEICNLIVEAGLDGNIIGSAARIFLSQEGINEIAVKSGINARFRPLFEPVATGHLGIMTRTTGWNINNNNIHNPYGYSNQQAGIRSYHTYR